MQITANCIYCISGKEIGRHFFTFFVDYFEGKQVHHLLQPVQSFCVHFAQFLQGFMVSEQFELSTFEMHFESFHAKNCCLHFQQKWGVIFLMFLQLATGIGNNVEFPLIVDLREDST